MENNTSPHASISFTAHYTGEMWQKLGLSHPALATEKGKKLHRLLSPIEWTANTFFGVTTNKTLTVRHGLMDERVEAFLAKHPQGQILEIAAGLSPRGWRFLQKYPELTYAEVDLPAMSALKQARAQNLPAPLPQFFAADIFTNDLTDIFASFDNTKPLLIVTEGLINYFSLALLADLSNILASHLAAFPQAMWLTENYPYSNKTSYNLLVKFAGATLGKLTKSDFSFYFEKPSELVEFFTQNGFAHANIFQPSQQHSPKQDTHLGDTVWVVELLV